MTPPSWSGSSRARRSRCRLWSGPARSRRCPPSRSCPTGASTTMRLVTRPAATEFFVPARLTDAVSSAVADAAERAHVALGLRDLSRADLIVDSAGSRGCSRSTWPRHDRDVAAAAVGRGRRARPRCAVSRAGSWRNGSGPKDRVSARQDSSDGREDASGRGARPSMAPTIRSRSSSVANSIITLPRVLPIWIRTRVSSRSDSRSDRSTSPGAVGRRTWRRGSGAARPAERHDLLDGPDRQPLRDDPVGDQLLRLRVVQPQQGPGMTGRQHAGGHPALHRRGQPQQPDGVGDLRPRAADPIARAPRACTRSRRAAARTRQPPPADSAGSMQVLEQGITQHRVVAGFPDDCRDVGQSGRLGGTPPPFAHHQLVRVASPTGRTTIGCSRPTSRWRGPARPSRPPRTPGGVAAGWA